MVNWQAVSGYVQVRKRDLILLAAIAVVAKRRRLTSRQSPSLEPK